MPAIESPVQPGLGHTLFINYEKRFAKCSCSRDWTFAWQPTKRLTQKTERRLMDLFVRSLHAAHEAGIQIRGGNDPAIRGRPDVLREELGIDWVA